MSAPQPSSRPALSRRNLVLIGLGFAAAAVALPFALPDRSQADGTPSAVMAADEAYAKAASGEIALVDIRTPQEWAQTGVPDGAIALDMTQEDSFVKALVALREANAARPIALICRTGNRSGHVVKVLAKQGFPGLVDVAEGIAGGRNGTGWLKRGLPTYEGNAHEIKTRRDKLLP